MTDRPQDTELRARFAAQRAAEANQAPSFASMLARARAADAADAAPAIVSYRLKLRRFVYASGLAAAAVIAALLLVPRSPSSEVAFEQTVRAFQNDPALGAWRSPTDGLLNVPGSQLITTMPRVGTPQ
jgi:isopentenyl diphosphate isomerase/L-lactate dehydrogenase-like FMN-dependent dehydrogenase